MSGDRLFLYVLHAPQDDFAARIVEAACVRSFTAGMVRRLAYEAVNGTPRLAVLINPGPGQLGLLSGMLAAGGKVAVFGNVAPEPARRLGLRGDDWSADDLELNAIETDAGRAFDLSEGWIAYADNAPLCGRNPLRQRHLCRFDFEAEWNNAGYGRVWVGEGPWAAGQCFQPDGIRLLAWIGRGAAETVSLYCGLLDEPAAAGLWVNRPVGPVDSHEWTIVEEFFCGYGAGRLICVPRLAELPAGVGQVVTVRFDCDQAVGSCRRIAELYADYGIPVSLAVLTGLELKEDDLSVLEKVRGSGGSLLSHSVRHLSQWGGSYEAAYAEARESGAFMTDRLGVRPDRLAAVSPFHQNPVFAVQALADAGYVGLVSGIIANDPEFLLGRAGRMPFCGRPFVGLSQQCMFHGDCYHRYGQSIAPYVEARLQARAAGAFFGYLDHPFSDAYQYGWQDEEERTAMHEAWIRKTREDSDIVWWNLEQCIGFLRERDAVELTLSVTGKVTAARPDGTDRFDWICGGTAGTV